MTSKVTTAETVARQVFPFGSLWWLDDYLMIADWSRPQYQFITANSASDEMYLFFPKDPILGSLYMLIRLPCPCEYVEFTVFTIRPDLMCSQNELDFVCCGESECRLQQGRLRSCDWQTSDLVQIALVSWHQLNMLSICHLWTVEDPSWDRRWYQSQPLFAREVYQWLWFSL